MFDFLCASVVISDLWTTAFHMCWNCELGVSARQLGIHCCFPISSTDLTVQAAILSKHGPRDWEKKAQWELKRCDLFPTPRCVLYLPDKTRVKKRWVFKWDVIKVCASRRWIRSPSEKNAPCESLQLVLWWFKTVLKWNVIIYSWVRKGKDMWGEEVENPDCIFSLFFAADTAIKVISVNDFSVYVQLCDEIQASWKALVYFCSFVSDQWLLRYGGAAPLHHYHSCWATPPPSRGRGQAINVRLKA